MTENDCDINNEKETFDNEKETFDKIIDNEKDTLVEIIEKILEPDNENIDNFTEPIKKRNQSNKRKNKCEHHETNEKHEIKETKESYLVSNNNNEIINIKGKKYMKQTSSGHYMFEDKNNNKIILHLVKDKNNLILYKLNNTSGKTISYKRCTYSNCIRKNRRDHCYFHTEMHDNKICIELDDLYGICFDENCRGNNLECVTSNKKHIYPLTYTNCSFHCPTEGRQCKNFINPQCACLFHKNPNDLCVSLGITTDDLASGKDVSIELLNNHTIQKTTETLDEIDNSNSISIAEQINETSNKKLNKKSNKKSKEVLNEESNKKLEEIKKEINEYTLVLNNCTKKITKYNNEQEKCFKRVSDIKKNQIDAENMSKKNQKNIAEFAQKMSVSLKIPIDELDKLLRSDITVDDIDSILEKLTDTIKNISDNRKNINKSEILPLNEFKIQTDEEDTKLTNYMRKLTHYSNVEKEINKKLENLNLQLTM
jgi:hypothetical protein